MAFDLMEDDVNIISQLGDEPNEDDGLSATELKEKFDRAPNLLKLAFNKLVNALNNVAAAKSMGFQRTTAIPADNVQDAIENVQSQISGSGSGSGSGGGTVSLTLVDVSADVTLTPRTNADKITLPANSKKFLFSSALGMVFYSFLVRTEGLSPGAYAIEQTGYPNREGNDSPACAVYCGDTSRVIRAFSQAGDWAYHLNIGGSTSFTTDSLIISGWYFCDRE